MRKEEERDRETRKWRKTRRNYNQGTPPVWPQSASLHILARQCSKLPRNSPCNHRRSQTFSGSDNSGGRSRRAGTTMRSLQNAGHRDFSQGSANQYTPLAEGEHLTRLIQVALFRRLSSFRETFNAYSVNLYIQLRINKIYKQVDENTEGRNSVIVEIYKLF